MPLEPQQSDRAASGAARNYGSYRVAPSRTHDYPAGPCPAAIAGDPPFDLVAPPHLSRQIDDRGVRVVERDPARVLSLDRARADGRSGEGHEVRDPTPAVPAL